MRTGYQGQSVLILDGYLPHIKTFESIDLQGEKLTLHFLVPHSSHLLQPLDLCIFSVMKGAQIRFRWFKNVSEQTQELVKIHQSLYKAATPTNCRSSFRAAGIMTKYYQNRHQVFELTYVDVNELDQIPYYQISHIEQLIAENHPLTQNQQIIYRNHSGSIEPPKGFRIPIQKC